MQVEAKEETYNFTAWITELKDVWRTPETFGEPTHPKTKGAYPGAIYTEQTNGKRWLGKLGSPIPDEELGSDSLRNSEFVRGANRDALKEKIAFDFYHVFSKCFDNAFSVPPSVLSVLKILNQFTQNVPWAQAVFHKLNQQKTVEASVHVLCEWIENFHELNRAIVKTPGGEFVPFMDYFRKTGILSDTIFYEGKETPLYGLIELLACARLLGDTDVLGSDGANTGFIILDNPPRAMIVKVDPGGTFTINHESLLVATLYPQPPIQRNILKDLKDTQYASYDYGIQIEWKNLTSKQKELFLETLNKGIKILENKEFVDFILKRNGEFVSNRVFIDHSLMTEKLENKFKNEILCLLEMQKKSFSDVWKVHEKESLFDGEKVDKLQKVAEQKSKTHIEDDLRKEIEKKLRKEFEEKLEQERTASQVYFPPQRVAVSDQGGSKYKTAKPVLYKEGKSIVKMKVLISNSSWLECGEFEWVFPEEADTLALSWDETS